MKRSFDEHEAEAIRAAVPPVLDRKARGKAEKPGVARSDDHLTVTGEPGELADIPAMLARRNIDPNDWIVERAVVNEWESSAMVEGEWIATTLHQLKIFLLAKPKLPADFFAFEPSSWKPPKERPSKLEGRVQLFLVTSDLQIPYHDAALHELSCRLAHDLKIDRWYDLGDEFDLPTLSRWPETRSRYAGDENFFTGITPTKEQGEQVFRDRASAVPDYCELHIVDSNHAERWEAYIIKNAPALWGIPHIREMAKLPEMGWQVHLSNYGTGTYQNAEVEILPGVIGIHGYEAKGYRRGGDSVMVELDQRQGVHVFQGHCNHQAHVQLVRGGTGDNWYLQHGYEVGMLGQRRMAYGARKVKDWQQGFCLIEAYPDGAWQGYEVPYYSDGVVRFRGQEWRV